MTGTEWLLALHVLSAVVLGAAATGFWVLLLGTRPAAAIGPAAANRLSVPLTVAIAGGGLLTLVFGVWLAIADDAYRVWDAWIVAAIVLWVVATVLGQRAGAILSAGPGGRGRGILLHGASSVVLLVLLALMLWRPGA